MERIWAVLLYILLVGAIWLFFKIGSFKVHGRNLVGLKWRILVCLLLPLVLVLVFLFSLLIFSVVLVIVVLVLLGFLFKRILKY